jgi:hypothetical protein
MGVARYSVGVVLHRRPSVEYMVDLVAGTHDSREDLMGARETLAEDAATRNTPSLVLSISDMGAFHSVTLGLDLSPHLQSDFLGLGRLMAFSRSTCLGTNLLPAHSD